MRFAKASAFLAVLSLFFTSCNSFAVPISSRLNIVATIPILGDVVANVGGDLINLTVLIPVNTDPHSFEAAPQDAARVSEAQVIFINGLDLEEFMQPLLDNASGHAEVVAVSDGVGTIEFEGEEHEGEEHGGADPHVWMNPLNVKIWADNIANTLAQADPANADVYKANAEAYKLELDELDRWANEQVGLISPTERQLVTDHDSFGYFAEHYGFEIVGAIVPSYSTGSEPAAGELADLETAIQQYGVNAIFVGVSINPALAEQVAADTGVQLVAVYTESLSESGGPAATYFDMIRYDVQAIVDALK